MGLKSLCKQIRGINCCLMIPIHLFLYRFLSSTDPHFGPEHNFFLGQKFHYGDVQIIRDTLCGALCDGGLKYPEKKCNVIFG